MQRFLYFLCITCVASTANSPEFNWRAQLDTSRDQVQSYTTRHEGPSRKLLQDDGGEGASSSGGGGGGGGGSSGDGLSIFDGGEIPAGGIVALIAIFALMACLGGIAI